MILPELLAPAGDWNALKAGIAAGADAVYVGGKAFSARQYAPNFDDQQLKKAVDFVHLHGKKIYVTVNTLIRNEEMGEALKFLAQLYNQGVDAVIIQDLGLIYMARQQLPSLELHASTQMTVHNLEGALFLKDLGIRRIVLARELTRDEVAAIVGKSGVEIEVFIHGALCICYSGQCLMSSMIGGRSGNRGRCAQPCRMEYRLAGSGTISKTEGPYLLSPKDQSLCGMIPELVQTGVNSLKIEGRMKRPEYVYQVVKTYRRVLDRFGSSPESFNVKPEEIQELEQAFNRGFSTGYFGGNRNYQLLSFLRPNNRGVYLGRIKSVDQSRRLIMLKLEAALESGDEVEIWVSKGGRVTGRIHDLELGEEKKTTAGPGTTVGFVVDGKVFPGDRVFKVFSARSSNEVESAIADDSPLLRIPCDVKVAGEVGSKLRVTYSDYRGNEGSAESGIPLQFAKTRPLTGDFLFEQLGRLGDTPYRLAAVHAELPEGVMLPVSELNQTRRRAVDALIASSLENYRRTPVAEPLLKRPNDFPGRHQNQSPALLSVWAGDLDGVIAAANQGADLIYAGGDELAQERSVSFHWEPRHFREAIRQAHASGARFIIGLPRIHREGQRSAWESQLRTVLTLEADGIMVSELGALHVALTEGECPVYLNYTLNLFNGFTVHGLQQQFGRRLEQVALSPELSLDQIRNFCKNAEMRLECLIHGPLELMISEYCLVNAVFYKTGSCSRICEKKPFQLRDRLNLDFPIVTDQYCRMHLLNSKDLCLLEDIQAVLNSPAGVLRLELKTFSAVDIGYLVDVYKNAITAVSKGDPQIAKRELAATVAELIARTGRGITKGHYFRGVE